MVLPILKWAGGKRWLTETIAHYYDPQLRLVEPFCGGMAIALGLSPQKALLNDINPHLINLYQQIKEGKILDSSLMIHDKEHYYKNRTRFNALIESGDHETLEAASLFYYLNKTGFNGLCRFNQKGLFNVPFGRYKKINYKTDFIGVIPQQWQFNCRSYLDLDIAGTDFVYADPPYDTEFTSYSKGGFSWGDQVEVAHWLATLDCPVITSNQATGRIIELYSDLDFKIDSVSVRRSVGAHKREKAVEILAFKNIDHGKTQAYL